MNKTQLELKVADLEAENGKLRAEIDNLQDGMTRPTIADLIGVEAFDHMVDTCPSFRNSGPPTQPSDPAAEVMWAAVQHIGELDRELAEVTASNKTNYSRFMGMDAQYERAIEALAEYAMREVEGDLS